MQHRKELQKLKAGIPDELWDALSDNGCYVAGGAITSVFTNKEINDFDVYFPSRDAFTKVFSELYKETWNEYREADYDLSFSSGIVSVVTSKALLLFQGESKIQFIVHDFYENAEAIFQDFDFTVCMGALNMKDDSWSFHEDFFKHNAQRYLHFNPKTSYPLISAMRVDKYKRLKGYEISKAQMFKILCAVNAKEINDWQTLMDEMGGMYGVKPEEIFDTTKPFSMEVAMEALDNCMIRDTMPPNAHSRAEIVKVIRHAFTEEYLTKRGL